MKKQLRFRQSKPAVILLSALLLVLFGMGVRRYFFSAEAEALRGRFNPDGAVVKAAGVQLNQSALVGLIYQDRRFEPIWTSKNTLLPRAKAFLKFLRSAQKKSFGRGGYHLDQIDALLALSTAEAAGAQQRRVDLELLLMDAYVHFGRQNQSGLVEPSTVYPNWFRFPTPQGNDAAIVASLKTLDSEQALRALEPTNSGYLRLREALARYRLIKQAGGWPVVPGGPELDLGDREDRVSILRERLQISGELDAPPSAELSVFDLPLAAALSKFQMRHGLPENGQLDEATREELNVLVEKRIRQMELNLERLRWLPKQLADRHIFVNVAACSLELIEKDQLQLKKRVIVGRNEQRTVLFENSVTIIEINPYWEAPEKIVRYEMLPRIKLNPAMLAQEGLRIFDGYDDPKEIKPKDIDWATAEPENFTYRLRQDPGPKNTLGCIKFLFPNEHCIFVHDTAERQLFENEIRTLSHGCIRLEQPLELAEHLLRRTQGWNHEEFQRSIESGVHQKINLLDPIPINIYYLTAWADRDGGVHFCRDVYLVDRDLATALMRVHDDSLPTARVE